MPIDYIPEQNPAQNNINLLPIVNPAFSTWWTTRAANGIPENVMGWLLAQGWEVTSIVQDNTTTPPTNYFGAQKTGLSAQAAVLGMCNAYTVAANEARNANQQRYREILASMLDMVDSSFTQFRAQVDEQNYQAGVFLDNLDTYMTEIETMISENQEQIEADAESAKQSLELMVNRLGAFETNANATSQAVTALFSEQAASVTALLNEYQQKFAEIDQEYEKYLQDIETKVSNVDDKNTEHLEEFLTKLEGLRDQWESHYEQLSAQTELVKQNLQLYIAKFEAILVKIQNDLSSIVANNASLQSELRSFITSYEGQYGSAANGIGGGLQSNATVTRALFDNLGQTELARINEQAASSLSQQMQQLVSRGLYTSIILSDFTARNNRDKEEQIQLLNDRLNREKVDNEHKLYEQSFAAESKRVDALGNMWSLKASLLNYQASLVNGIYAIAKECREKEFVNEKLVFDWKDLGIKLDTEIKTVLYNGDREFRQKFLDYEDKKYQLEELFRKWEYTDAISRYEKIQQIKSQHAAIIQPKFSAKQEATKVKLQERHTLLSELQSALTSFISGREKYAVLLMQNANTLAEHKHKAILQLMDSSVRRLEGWKNIADQNRALLAYQLDERNKILVGLYAFVERREDVAPEWKDVAQMIAGLGDSGGGWLTPT